MSTETRWFTTKTGRVWHALTVDRDICRAECRSSIHPSEMWQQQDSPSAKCASCVRKLADRDAAPEAGPKTCGTVGCKLEATHTLTYTFPESRDQPETDTVCEFCGLAYTRRPTLRASLTPIAAPGKVHTWADSYGTWHASVPLTDDSAEVARNAIIAELRQRWDAPNTLTRMTVERERVTDQGTVVYAEAWPGEDDYDSTMADSTVPAPVLDDTSRTVDIVSVGDVPWEVSGSLSEVALWLGNATEHDRQAIRLYARDIAAPGIALRITFPSVMTFIMDYAGNGRYRIYVPGGAEFLDTL